MKQYADTMDEWPGDSFDMSFLFSYHLLLISQFTRHFQLIFCGRLVMAPFLFCMTTYVCFSCFVRPYWLRWDLFDHRFPVSWILLIFFTWVHMAGLERLDTTTSIILARFQT